MKYTRIQICIRVRIRIRITCETIREDFIKSATMSTNMAKFAKRCCKFCKIPKMLQENVLDFSDLRSAKGCKSDRSRQELSNEQIHHPNKDVVAKIGVDAVENRAFQILLSWRGFSAK